MESGYETEKKGRGGGTDDDGRRMEHQLTMVEEERSTN
jgi:hypothetical protein